MPRIVTVGAAQLGPIQRDEGRAVAVERMVALLNQAHEKGCDLVVFPELALTTFFPRWYSEDWAEVDGWFEREMPGPETAPLFDAARAHGIGFCLGYAELTEEAGALHRYNTSILVDKVGAIVGKYRKVHLPGHAEYDPERAWQHLEKRYFEPGNLGFPVWRAMGGVMGMCICNDRRWPETYRVMGLQGVIRSATKAPSSACSTTTSPCRQAPIRTAPGWWGWPRRATRTSTTLWAAASSSRPRARSWPNARAWATSWSPLNAISMPATSASAPSSISPPTAAPTSTA
jgi:hypothetical protein